MQLKITLNSINCFLIAIFFVLLASVPNFFTFEGKNLLLIGFSVLLIVILVLINFRSVAAFHEWLPLLLLFYMSFSVILNSEDSQFSSLAYSVFFICTYIFYSGWAKQEFSIEYYKRLLKFIFILYFIGLLAGQLYVSAGLFTPVEGVAGFVKGHFGTTLESGGYRYYSLSSEPSYASFIVILLFYSYVSLSSNKNSLLKGENLFLFIMLLYMIFFFRSGYGIVLLGILMVNYVGLSRTSVIIYFVIFVLIILFFLFGKQLFGATNFPPLQRVLNVIDRFDITDPRSLFQADFNTYFRIAPIFYYFESSSLTDWQFYFGHGASTSKEFIVPSIFTAYVGGEYLGGFMPAFVYDYGVIGAIIVFILILRLLPTLLSISAVIAVLLLTNANLNTQLFWFILICFSMNKHFIQQKKEHETVY